MVRLVVALQLCCDSQHDTEYRCTVRVLCRCVLPVGVWTDVVCVRCVCVCVCVCSVRGRDDACGVWRRGPPCWRDGET